MQSRTYHVHHRGKEVRVMTDNEGKAPSAVTFHGSWTDFAKIALPNVLLTLVTLGVYRFWATTRERH